MFLWKDIPQSFTQFRMISKFWKTKSGCRGYIFLPFNSDNNNESDDRNEGSVDP
jgi:hypothetical protein